MKHYLQYIQEVALRKWDEAAFTDFRTSTDYTYGQLAAKSGQFRTLYRTIGLAPGDRVALCGANSSLWAIAFIANQSYGAVSVPILNDFTPESVAKLCAHSGSSVLFIERPKFAGMDPGTVPGLKLVIDLADYSCIWASEPRYSDALEFAMSAGEEFLSDRLPFAKGRTLDELAVINYTSGTTGEPKGVMISSRAISANVDFGLEHDPVDDGCSSLCTLPLAHMFGLSFEFLYSFCGGSHIHFLGGAPSPSLLLSAFAKVRPYILVSVPMVLEKIVKSRVYPVMQKPVVRVLTSIPVLRRIVFAVMRRKFLAALGGRVTEIPLGGAALDPGVEKILRKMRIPFTVGYGMTECAPLICYSNWKHLRPGSCGRELGQYARVRIDSADPHSEVGEVQVKGDVVMQGYFRNPEATGAAFTPDGWLRTGDLGILGKDGSLYLKGRSKCMILSSNGQNVYPEEIEALLNSQPEVEESLVVSRGGRITALLSFADGAAASSAAASELVKTVIERVNRLLPGYSRLADGQTMTEPFVHTPKHSIKRSLYS